MDHIEKPGVQFILEGDLRRYRQPILARCPAREYPAGHLFQLMGLPNAPLYYLAAGTVEIYTTNPLGYARLIGIHRADTLFNLDRFGAGELDAVISSRAATPVTAATVTMEDLAALAAKLHGARLRPAEHKEIKGLENIDKIINIDQSPIGRTPRSNPATYTGVFDFIRELFSQTNEAKMRGYKPGRFSFNVKGGRCEACRGDGMNKIEMNFLPDVYVPCEVCHGARYNRDTLEVHYKGKSIAEVLDMTVTEACEFFKNLPRIARKLQVLEDVGLGYIHLGQAATTLSGGEAQRVKLATELSRRSTGKTLYLLDEPTTGLHIADVHKLLDVLQRLVEAGDSVVVIEHNLDVIKTADYLIDLGPEGGDKGGTLVACGTPEKLAKVKKSYTGQYVKQVLKQAKDNGWYQ